MNRERTRNGKPTSEIHKLVVAEPERARPSGRVLLIMSMALTAGIATALLWVYQNPRGSLETLPEVMAQASATALAASELSSTEVMSPTDVAATEGDDSDGALNVDAQAVGTGRGMAVASANNLSAQLAPAQQSTLAPPTPTATSTPLPLLESVEAIIGIGGAQVWDAGTGELVGEGAQGSLFTATAQSSDGQWLYGTLEDGSLGWVSVDQLLVLNETRLPTEDVVIIPITPTPAAVAGAASDDGGTQDAGTQTEVSATETPILRPTPVPGDAVQARVTLQDSRLNLRSGPASSYPVISKALPDTIFSVIGRDATSQWLQVALPDVEGGFGWGAAEFFETDSDTANLRISDEVSGASIYQEGMGETKGGEALPQQPPDAQTTHPGGALVRAQQAVTTAVTTPASATGLTGKLAIQTTWGGDIHIYDLATGELRLLTGGFDPAISPDGTQVAFTRIGGEHGLYVINIDGSNERKVFSERTHFLSPKWSPDGKYLLFERGDELLNCTLQNPEDRASPCLVDLEPENATEVQQKLARVDLNGGSYQDIPVLPRARVPDWNSAGIVYQSPAGIQKTQDQPGAQTELVFFNIRKQYELDPDWQPNGGQIIFQRRENDHWEIYSVAPDGSGLRALTFPAYTLVEKLASNVAPAWSPDGQHIVYLSNLQPNQSAGDWDVWVMDADGANRRPLNIDLPFNYTYVAEQMLDWGR